MYLLGIFGTEQLFLRFSNSASPNVICTSPHILWLVAILCVISSLSGTWFLKNGYPELNIGFSMLLLSSAGMAALLFLFNVLRLNSDFFLAQVAANYWKVALFVISIFFYLTSSRDLDAIMFLVAINIIGIFIASVIFVRLKIRLVADIYIPARKLIAMGFHFLLAIIGFSLITFADRLLIESKYSVAEFGNFFYISNFFLAPYSILQSYIGFKQLIFFKMNFTESYLSRFGRKSIILGIGVGIFLFALGLAIEYLEFLNFTFSDYIPTILLLLLTGTVRLYSSTVLSAFEARTTIETLKLANIYIAIITVAGLGILYFAVRTFEAILAGVLAIWILRCVIHRQLLLRKLNDQSE